MSKFLKCKPTFLCNIQFCPQLSPPPSPNENDFNGPVETPDYIIAGDKVIDRNDRNPRRIQYPRGSEHLTDRQTSPPWYTSHYQALTQGIEAIEYHTW